MNKNLIVGFIILFAGGLIFLFFPLRSYSSGQWPWWFEGWVGTVVLSIGFTVVVVGLFYKSEAEKMKQETPLARKLKILIAVISAIIIALLISLLAVVPLAFGNRYISPSFELHYYVGMYVGERMDIVYINGSVVRVGVISFAISVTNSYFRPVYVHYNGFETVLLIYNRGVDEPSDVVGNKDFLVWGAFSSEDLPGWYPILTFEENIGTQTAYDYYVARKDLSNFTMEIPVAGVGGSFIGDPSFGDPWYGQNISGKPIPPGTYYIYCIAFGQVSKPFNLTVVSVLWE